MVGTETSDDAAVYKLSAKQAIVSTLDFFPPIVDDPYTFGQIAAANALSDIYAMGANPSFALNIACFPSELPVSILSAIINGSIAKLDEAKVALAGGHTIADSEIKYGLSVTGFVHPGKIVKNSTAKPGDLLILTKPLGAGIITTALRNGVIRPSSAEDAIAGMKELNKSAALAMVKTGVSACTDVSGYGLLGHALEMASGSKVSLTIDTQSVGYYANAMRLAADKANIPGGLHRNLKHVSSHVDFANIDKRFIYLLCDPQTSGGLLISVSKSRAGSLVRALKTKGVSVSIIGEVRNKGSRNRIKVL